MVMGMAFAGLTCQDFFQSWHCAEGFHSTDEIMSWIAERSENVSVQIEKVPFARCQGWEYHFDEGVVRNSNGKFFQISALRCTRGDGRIVEQPIIIQPEIGYLGILCKRIDGVLHLLMQAKIEPGNVNAVQLSPTIQATKSNFTRQHKGKAPAYLELFLDADPSVVVVDSLQSEQASRFLGKRNRNIIVYTEAYLYDALWAAIDDAWPDCPLHACRQSREHGHADRSLVHTVC